ncbi:unnamed protein product [Cyprideis torosa]|uniref:Uncharacterized protein n=1 Tax=Cyprideis torosa TaxID=163714 RepID=A0A7R8W8M0_9CRUS|nr:unnamed protein product [Cyprideis torosa]CAG0883603.1 unnamed protein product [Cyprideis torosa]
MITTRLQYIEEMRNLQEMHQELQRQMSTGSTTRSQQSAGTDSGGNLIPDSPLSTSDRLIREGSFESLAKDRDDRKKKRTLGFRRKLLKSRGRSKSMESTGELAHVEGPGGSAADLPKRSPSPVRFTFTFDGADPEAAPTTPQHDEAKGSKVSKWSKVKEAFKWEKLSEAHHLRQSADNVCSRRSLPSPARPPPAAQGLPPRRSAVDSAAPPSNVDGMNLFQTASASRELRVGNTLLHKGSSLSMSSEDDSVCLDWNSENWEERVKIGPYRKISNESFNDNSCAVTRRRHSGPSTLPGDTSPSVEEKLRGSNGHKRSSTWGKVKNIIQHRKETSGKPKTQRPRSIFHLEPQGTGSLEVSPTSDDVDPVPGPLENLSSPACTIAHSKSVGQIYSRTAQHSSSGLQKPSSGSEYRKTSEPDSKAESSPDERPVSMPRSSSVSKWVVVKKAFLGTSPPPRSETELLPGSQASASLPNTPKARRASEDQVEHWHGEVSALTAALDPCLATKQEDEMSNKSTSTTRTRDGALPAASSKRKLKEKDIKWLEKSLILD